MMLGERRRARALALILLLAGLGALGIAMSVPSTQGPPAPRVWRSCQPPYRCRTIDISELALDGRVRELTTLYAAPAGLNAPLAVSITGMASAEVWWNGVRIGGNGVVGDRPATEIPGRFNATIPVPPQLVRAGANQVVVRLSAQHLWAPVARPIHQLRVGIYEPDSARLFVHYLPTLIVLGMLFVALVACLGLWAARRSRGDALLSGLAATVLLQAAIETAKLAMVFPYPWQLARLVAVAGLATLAAVLLVLASRDWVEDRRLWQWLVFAAAAGLAASWLALPWWDAKAIWAIRAGIGVALVSAAIGAAGGRRLATAAGSGCILALGISGTSGFLDIGYYLLCAGLFAAYIVLGVRSLRRIERVTIVSAAQPPEVVILVPDGGTQHRVSMNDFLYARADDDYTIVCLTGGRELMATINLAAFVRLAPERMLRVHRSHAINPDKVEALHRAGKFARTVVLVGGERLAVGRTYWGSVMARLAMSTADL